jgi:hypothetical protein
LHVRSNVRDFTLAEEASYLLQCLEGGHGAELRFVDSSTPRPLLSLTETKGLLHIALESETPWSMNARIDEVRGACSQVGALLTPLRALTPPAEERPTMMAEPEKPRRKTWLIATGIAAGLLGTYLLLRPSSGEFSGVRPVLR